MANESTEQVVEQTQDNGTSTQTKTGESTSQQTQQTTQKQEPQFTYKEDRSKWIPDSRFKEVNTGYQTEKQRAAALEQELANERKRVQALAGVTPQAPEEQEAEQVRQAFFKMFPQFSKLSPEAIDKLLQVAEGSDKQAEAASNYWRNHGRQMIGKAHERISDELGGGELTERQQKRIAREYITFIEENASEGALDRHEAGDEKLITEFATAFLADWKDSLRRSVTATETNRNRPVPSGRGRSAVPSQKKPINYGDNKAVEDAAVEFWRENGGGFGG